MSPIIVTFTFRLFAAAMPVLRVFARRFDSRLHFRHDIIDAI